MTPGEAPPPTTLDEVPTPALIVDAGALDRNIARMARFFAEGACRLRPHVKAHKTPAIARRQLAAGSCTGLTCATVLEAEAVAAFCDDILIANELVTADKCGRAAALAASRRVTVAVDSAEGLDALSAAARGAGTTIGVLVDVNVGQMRCGVLPGEAALALATRAARTPGIELRGVMGYEGHVQPVRDRAEREAQARRAMHGLLDPAAQLRGAGLPCEIVSAGGTGTYDITGNDARVTEIQAGSYVFMDNFHGNLVPGFLPALTVLGTVIIQHGNTIVLDAGRKSVGIDFVLPTMIDYPFYQARYFAEEHALFDVDERCALKLGDTTELIPGYAPTTVNLYDVYHVVEKGVVVEVWPIIPRGPGHVGLLAR